VACIKYEYPPEIRFDFGWGCDRLVVFSNAVLHLTPESPAFRITGPLFLFLPTICIGLGIRERRKRNGDRLMIGEGIVTGVAIMGVYSVIAALFFVTVGFRFLTEPGTGPQESLFSTILRLMIPPMVGGILLSTVISFFLRRGDTPES